jgi:hypothetical protein
MSAAPSLLDYVSESDLDRLADVIAALLIAGARRQIVTAAASRTACAADQRETHDDQVSRRGKPDLVVEEDADRGHATNCDA